MKSRERIRTGFERMMERKVLLLFPILWLIASVMAIYMGKNILRNMRHPFSSDLFIILFMVFFVEVAIFGMCVIVAMIGKPIVADRIERELSRAGFTDKTGESPILLSYKKDRKGVLLELFSKQISIAEYEKYLEKLETLLNMKIVSIEMGRDKRHVIVKAIDAAADNKKILPWQDSYLSEKDFELVLGEGYFGVESIDIAMTPHMILAGSSGSGKSKLLQLVLMESIKKGAKVFLADFKGGVDYPLVWHKECDVITEPNAFDSQLSQILDEMERRRDLFVKTQTCNIREYNKKTGADLPRIIVACDEVAEVLDKTGLTKNEKELVSSVESKLSMIARQGRAFGIHLVLSTQRPDADILKGQIKNNIGYRVCGRCDKVLSQIILDTTEGAEKISPKDQGLFYTNMGTLFKAYFVEDECLKGVELNDK